MMELNAVLIHVLKYNKKIIINLEFYISKCFSNNHFQLFYGLVELINLKVLNYHE